MLQLSKISSLEKIHALSVDPTADRILMPSEEAFSSNISACHLDGSFHLDLKIIVEHLQANRCHNLRVIELGSLDSKPIEQLALRHATDTVGIEFFCLDQSISGFHNPDFPRSRILCVDLLDSEQTALIPSNSFDLIFLVNVFSGETPEVRATLAENLFPMIERLLTTNGIALLGIDYCKVSEAVQSEFEQKTGASLINIFCDNWALIKSDQKPVYQELLASAGRSFCELNRERVKAELARLGFPPATEEDLA